MSVRVTHLLPKLPPAWRATPVRYATTCLDGRRVPLNGDERGRRQGEFPYWGANGVVDAIDAFIFDEPLVLLGEDGAPFFDKGKSVAFFVTGRIWVNNHIHVLRTEPGFEPRFVAYALNATDYTPWIEGSTRDKLTQDKMGSILLPTPPLAEQQSIANFLDKESTQIDGLLATKQRLLDLLAEKRKAIIATAVTRGLDPKARMAPTGVEWMPGAPAHWRPSRIGRLFRQSKVLGFPDLTVLSVYREYGVIARSSRDDNANVLPDDLTKYQLVEAGDLVVNKMKAWQGSLGISELRGITSPDYVVFRPTHSELPAYLHFMLRTPQLTTVYLSNSNGIRINQWRIEPDRFLNVPVLLPSMAEQHAIVEHITCETAKLDAVRAATERTIALLKERRSALIAAAVTGELDLIGYRPATRGLYGTR